MTSTSQKGLPPDPYDTYIKSRLITVSQPDYSAGVGAEAGDWDIAESVQTTNDCLRIAYRFISEMGSSAHVSAMIEAATTVDTGLGKLAQVDEADDATAQPILQSIKDSLVKLKAENADLTKSVVDCVLKTGHLPEKWKKALAEVL